MNCIHCGNEEFINVRRVEADGHTVAFRQCLACGENWDGKFLPKAKINFSSLPWTTPMTPAICEHCGRTYAQEHHYFPRSIARLIGMNPDSWPTQKLCGECHGTWHENVTPGLVKKDW